MSAPFPEEVGGYVLAGGRSSRMGRDKALLELGGTPLISHAVKKLRRVCMGVRVLSDNAELEAYAPVVRDIHPGCGPMSGMEAALQHSAFEWNLFLAVDMPFVPTAFLSRLLRFIWRPRMNHPWGEWVPQVRMFTADGRPQPGLSMVHRDIAPFLTDALERGEYKLVPVLEAAAQEVAVRKGVAAGGGIWCLPLTSFEEPRENGTLEDWCYTTPAQMAAFPLWFANLNTPEDFAEAARHADALDT